MSVLGVVGCGLLGSSFALAAKRANCFDRILGRDDDQATVQSAIELGIFEGSWCNGESVNAVCVAVPTDRIASIVQDLWEVISQEVPIFDVGSVKSSILQDFDEVPSNYVPCHPIAGSHRSGPHAASADLFEQATCVVTPTPTTDDECLNRVVSWWETVGATVLTMSAAEHDFALALTSHLPHLLSVAAVELLRDKNNVSADFVGGGFRDFSRIAAADARMWQSIFGDNLVNLRQGFRELSTNVETLLTLAESDPEQLESRLRGIAEFRDSLNNG